MTSRTMQIGDLAPDFTLPTTSNQNFTLSNCGRNVVLYFYPKDDTPGCTLEAKDFADLMPEFSQLDTIIIGVSKDDLPSHEKFAEKYCLPFTLASDIDHKVCELYGVWGEKSMFGKKYMGVERSTFLIGLDGKIKKSWLAVSVSGHAKDVLTALKEL